MLRKLLPALILLLQAVGAIHAQTCTALGQTPASAFPVCGTSTFSQTTVPICSTQLVPGPCPNSGLFYDRNPFWYTFTCFSPGQLVFLITPNTFTDDYDWQLFDVTGHNPNDVFTDSSLFVACNWSGESGYTGTADTGTSLIWCDGFGVPTFSSPPYLQQGHVYLLLISHFTVSQSGYSLSFGGGTAVITDTTPPRVASATVNCSGTSIFVKLNKKMKCSSLAINGSDFIVQGGTPPVVTSATGVNCTSGFSLDSIVLTLSSPLAAGTYNVVAQNGSDANTLLDICNTPIPVGNSVSFTFNPQPPPFIDSIAPVGCAPQQLQIHFNTPVQCNSIAPDGSDLALSSTTPVSITGASSSCTGQLTSVVTLQLSAPIYHQGINTVRIKNGIDGNTLISECGVQALVGDSITVVTPADTVSAHFTFNIAQQCHGDTVSFFSSNSNGINQWLWQIDTATSALQNPVYIYHTFGTQQVSLSVTNGVCSDTAAISFTLNPPPPIAITITAHPTTCGNSNGSADVTATGGTGNLNILWVPSNYTTDSISNLAPGIYHLVVTDSIGCTKADSVRVDSIRSPQITAVSHNDVSCHGLHNGSASATIINGTRPYSYSWTNGTSILTGNPIQNLDTGTYQLTVVDSTGCIQSGNVTIDQPPKLSHSVSSVSATCAISNGSAIVQENGGTAPYTYTWLPSGGNSDTATGLGAGNYLVSIVDFNGCEDTARVQITTSNTLSLVVSNIAPVSCYGDSDGAATVIATGNPPYVYSWMPNGGNSATALSLSAGLYSVKVIDSTGCTDSATITITAPDSLTVTVSTTSASCGNNNGIATASVSGGTTPYSYTWLPSGGTSGTAINLSAGNYALSITDAKGCTDTAHVQIVSSNALSTAVSNITPVSCYGGSNGAAMITATGNPPYFYMWMPMGGNSATATSLAAGTYTVHVSDSAACSDSVLVIITSPAPLVVNVSSTGTTCGDSNGTATASASGGIAPYTYLWSSGNTNSILNSLAWGAYNVTVADANGCTAQGAASIAQSQPLMLTLTATPTVVAAGGSVGFSVTGNLPFSVTGWQPATAFTNQTATAQNIHVSASGIFSVSATTSDGCLDTAQMAIQVISSEDVFIPNTFTPNGDRRNDVLYVYGNTISAVDLAVFNQWGEKIFESNSQLKGWDGTYKGKPQPTGVYMYVAKIVSTTGREILKKGSVNLIR